MSGTYFQNKKCLVTGAASGIGKSTATLLAIKGAHLFLTDINEDALKNTVDEIVHKGGKVSDYKAFNICDAETIKNWSEEIHSKYQTVDIILNIAGISSWGAIDKMTNKDWELLIDINLKGPMHILEHFTPAMIQNKKGHIVNVSSAAGLFGLPWHGAYSATKFGLRGLSEVLKYDLKRHGIHVHVVCPGAVDTGLVQTLKIVGTKISEKQMLQLKSMFQSHAVTPDQAANSILKGIENKDYLIFTSTDIRLAYWAKRSFPFLYDLAMQKMNDYFQYTLTQKQ